MLSDRTQHAVDRAQFLSAVAQRMAGVLGGSNPDAVALALHGLAAAATSSDQAPLPLLSSPVRAMYAEVCLDRLEGDPLQDGAHADRALALIVHGPLFLGGQQNDRSWLALLRAHLLRVYRHRGLTEADLAADQSRCADVAAALAGRGWVTGPLAHGDMPPSRDWNMQRLRDLLAVLQPYVRVAIWDAVRVNAPLAASVSETVITDRILGAVGGLAGFLAHSQLGNLGLFHLVHSHLVNAAAPPPRTIDESRRLILDWAMTNFA